MGIIKFIKFASEKLGVVDYASIKEAIESQGRGAEEPVAHVRISHSIAIHAPMRFDTEAPAAHLDAASVGAMITPTYASVVALATTTFDTIDDAESYLRTPKGFLRGQTPMEVARKPEGAALVEAHLNWIDGNCPARAHKMVELPI